MKIRVFKGGETTPATTVTIPGGVLKVASKLIPKQAAAALLKKGIDLDEIIRLSASPDVHGTLLEVEDHKENEGGHRPGVTGGSLGGCLGNLVHRYRP